MPRSGMERAREREPGLGRSPAEPGVLSPLELSAIAQVWHFSGQGAVEGLAGAGLVIPAICLTAEIRDGASDVVR